ncbi:MAG: tRNA 4-thiouridine(8) synthase ThiI [Erysipelothrix sp.]|nr:tRNA 4-thiouridine(8) synthase ThiI [Erysipelothrix sp.]
MDIRADICVVRFAELSTKGKNKKDFVRLLRKNINEAMRSFEGVKVVGSFDRIYVYLYGADDVAVLSRLQQIFGISTISLAVKVNQDIELMTEVAVGLMKKEPKSTFKVITRRADKTFPLVTDQINRALGTAILMNTDHVVDVHDPKIKVLVEVRPGEVFITVNTVQGAHGFPVGIQGKAMLLLSGGIDSPVAAYLSNKRGIEIECVHFQSPPYTSAAALSKVKDLTRKLTAGQSEIRMHIVNFTELQLQINHFIPESYRITIMRRMMIRISEGLAIKRKCKALITGECVGQVASQTLDSIQVISNVASLPILRPLVMFDKNDIIAIAEKIGTYETSIRPYEDCCTVFTPVNPVTRPFIQKAENFEKSFDFRPYVIECIEKAETVFVKYNEKRAEDTLF